MSDCSSKGTAGLPWLEHALSWNTARFSFQLRLFRTHKLLAASAVSYLPTPFAVTAQPLELRGKDLLKSSSAGQWPIVTAWNPARFLVKRPILNSLTVNFHHLLVWIFFYLAVGQQDQRISSPVAIFLGPTPKLLGPWCNSSPHACAVPVLPGCTRLVRNPHTTDSSFEQYSRTLTASAKLPRYPAVRTGTPHLKEILSFGVVNELKSRPRVQRTFDQPCTYAFTVCFPI